MSKKTLTIVFIAAIIIIVIAVIVYVFRCNIFPKLSSCVADPNKDGIPVPTGSPTPTWVDEFFPLNVGMFGPQIKKLQTALGIEADGKFGSQTATSVTAKGKVVPLDKPGYDSIVNPASSGGGSNFSQIKETLKGGSTNFNGGISYLVPGQNKNFRFDFYTNGRFFVNTAGTNDALKKGDYYEGGNRMVINTYNYRGTPVKNMQYIVKTLE